MTSLVPKLTKKMAIILHKDHLRILKMKNNNIKRTIICSIWKVLVKMLPNLKKGKLFIRISHLVNILRLLILIRQMEEMAFSMIRTLRRSTHGNWRCLCHQVVLLSQLPTKPIWIFWQMAPITQGILWSLARKVLSHTPPNRVNLKYSQSKKHWHTHQSLNKLHPEETHALQN